MNKKKAIQIYNELKAKCPGLILAGSVLRGKEEDIRDLDLVWVGKIFPLHLLPVGEMKKDSASIQGSEVLRFTYRGEKVDIHRTTEKKLPGMILHLSGPWIKV